MRVVSWNVHGADVPGCASNAQQLRAWEYMRDEFAADHILAQEVSATALPRWVQDWSLVAGTYGTIRKNWRWALPSAIVRFEGLVFVSHSWYTTANNGGDHEQVSHDSGAG